MAYLFITRVTRKTTALFALKQFPRFLGRAVWAAFIVLEDSSPHTATAGPLIGLFARSVPQPSALISRRDEFRDFSRRENGMTLERLEWYFLRVRNIYTSSMN